MGVCEVLWVVYQVTQQGNKQMTHIVAYKGFNADWTCRDFQYEVGKTYTHDGNAVACESGFHACENPLNVLGYYPPTGKFAEVHMSGAISREENGDTKVASAEIHIKVELSLHDFIGRAVKWLTDNAKEKGQHVMGYRSAASATGYRSAASATGYRSAASATGYRSAASATGDQSAASATGDQSAASATGDRSAASATGDQSAAMGAGYQNKVMGKDGCAIFLVERDDNYNILNARGFVVGRDCKPDQWYKLINNELVEVE
jgi:hypothetical protein